ncbi:helicase-related protein [Amycolatopsis rubida]|uniref:Helicase conserved C-terminal domain-containing protein n=1 Tax=Amycolatopsis rubida TaxID=112413 RepID=A0A1I5W909_9PSEU|nr:helicase-related protein [Amycolatopsis rubida]SFQ16215.1 Helicase conserved C-terminal domain-containing protein [Amycolatopsis rubida]
MTALRHQHYGLRGKLRTALRADLLGPVDGVHEVLASDAPITAYPIGVLFPQREPNEPPGFIEEGGAYPVPELSAHKDIEQDEVDLGVALSNQRRPSSMGMTFSVDTEVAPYISIVVEGARYVPEDAEGNPVEAGRTEARSTDDQRERWRRVPVEIEPVVLDVTVAGTRKIEDLAAGLELRALVRAPADGVVTATVTLVNTLTCGEYDLQDAYCFFQAGLTATGPDGSLAFVERPTLRGAVDQEQALSRLLHRHVPSFATGHGCSVAWDWEVPALYEPIASCAVASIRTEFIPTYEVLLTDSNGDIDNAALDMSGLGVASADQIGERLRSILDGYAGWIEARDRDIAFLGDPDHVAAARDQISYCRSALARMREGLSLLVDETRPELAEAFRLANRAMAEQRARTQWIKGGRPGEPDLAAARWRPFQIAFMLQCLAGIVDQEHEDREVADLLWFPTGGGKTEAYLGLIAFTVFLRRLRDGADGAGVTVLMRYTLRLLTLQQFERAATLICAMDVIRAKDTAQLGKESISIGMWVGQSATPNDLQSAKDSLAQLRRNHGKQLSRKNPIQLRVCPWCGNALTADDYEVVEAERRMTMRCRNTLCEFSPAPGLPVHVVDQAVYHWHPTLVIATVDKFASLPWRPTTEALFNRDLNGVRPPELIVQDELHLISGPLGTLTGMYETAVDILAERPKVVASTATIRRASDQVTALFDRRLAQFPPAGLDARDSWFAVETPRTAKASRRYLGLLTASTSQTTLLVRAYAALLHGAARAREDGATPELLDPYWTLVGYFNSLRLLSAAELQVRDDVQDRLEALSDRDGSAKRADLSVEDLSSRADSTKIPELLKMIERGLPAGRVLDVLLATNMISVGVDIDRLGLMAVMGQPQTTAEYIQATSRVGRLHPGLVTVILNSMRSRDRSHYESFPTFHSALYREVESTSVTPFSARARDRGLHAVVVALARMLIPGLRENSDAHRIEKFVAEVESTVRAAILDRVEKINPEEAEAAAEQIDNFVQWWRERAVDQPELVYEAKRGSGAPALLIGFSAEETASADAQETLWSLRDVDAESALFLEYKW